MGRQRVSAATPFDRWRARWRKKLVKDHGEAFAAEAMAVLDQDVAAFGADPDDAELHETIIPALVLNLRRSRDARS